MAKKINKRLSSVNPLRFHIVLAALAFGALFGGVGVYFLSNSNAATPPCVRQYIGNGSTGQCVRDVQRLLNGLRGAVQGYGGTNLAVDGADGSNTTAQIRHFQAHFVLTTDGIVGPNTWRTLCNQTKYVKTFDNALPNWNWKNAQCQLVYTE